MKKVRAIFLSDIHLGTRACQAERLLAFLKEYESDYLYLVGDIVDIWAMRRTIYWPPEHNTIVQKILRKARHQTKILFVPGNHDEALRHYLGMSFGALDIVGETVHTTATGKKLLLLHGDQYDQVTTCARWLSVLGDVSYTLLVHINRVLAWLRQKLNVGGHWSLADYAKRNVLKAVAFIGDFEHAAARTAVERGVDGIVCGHIHTPVIRPLGPVTYYNCGDWVDNCTGLIEHMDGHMELVRVTPELTVVPVSESQVRLVEPAAPQPLEEPLAEPVRMRRAS